MFILKEKTVKLKLEIKIDKAMSRDQMKSIDGGISLNKRCGEPPVWRV